jgi:hypothetical protein
MSGDGTSAKNLRDLLARLRDRLSHARAMDADSRTHLSAVVTDIDTDLGRGGAASAHAPKLELLAARFEANHPALAESIREVIDALVKGGI